MPRGPNGEWSPADRITRAVHVMKIATGQIEETFEPPRDPNESGAANGLVRRCRKHAVEQPWNGSRLRICSVRGEACR